MNGPPSSLSRWLVWGLSVLCAVFVILWLARGCDARRDAAAWRGYRDSLERVASLPPDTVVKIRVDTVRFDCTVRMELVRYSPLAVEEGSAPRVTEHVDSVQTIWVRDSAGWRSVWYALHPLAVQASEVTISRPAPIPVLFNDKPCQNAPTSATRWGYGVDGMVTYPLGAYVGVYGRYKRVSAGPMVGWQSGAGPTVALRVSWAVR